MRMMRSASVSSMHFFTHFLSDHRSKRNSFKSGRKTSPWTNEIFKTGQSGHCNDIRVEFKFNEKALLKMWKLWFCSKIFPISIILLDKSFFPNQDSFFVTIGRFNNRQRTEKFATDDPWDMIWAILLDKIEQKKFYAFHWHCFTFFIYNNILKTLSALTSKIVDFPTKSIWKCSIQKFEFPIFSKISPCCEKNDLKYK